MLPADVLLRELAARASAEQFDPAKVLTAAQLGFRQDTSRFKMALCSRGAGKTTVCGEGLLDFARARENANCAYVTGTRRMAKNIMWPILLRLNEKYRLGFTPNHSDLVLHHEKGGRIQLSGANNVVEIDKLRGQPWDLVNVDEGQSLGRTLNALINEVLAPRLVDRNGSVWLTGTPGPVLGGPFYAAWKAGKAGRGWSLHEWTMADNPHILAGRQFTAIVAEEAARRGVSIDDPSILREFFGQWAQDLDALVFALTERNYFREPPELDGYVVGVDIGYDDADAIAVLGWKWVADKPRTYLIEESVNRKANVSDLGDRVADVVNRYQPVAVTVDTGGIGKKVAAELSSDRWGIPIVPFQKGEKAGRALLLRAAIARGEFLCKQDGQFDHDSKLLQWEIDADKGVRRLSDKSPDDKAFHSDIVDAVIGAYMESMAHHADKPAPQLSVEEQIREQRKAARVKPKGDLFDGPTSSDLFGDPGGGGLWE